MKYHQSKLTNGVAMAAGLTPEQAAKAIQATFDLISGALFNGAEVQVDNFGVFAPKLLSKTRYRDLRSKKLKTAKARYVARFRQSKFMRVGMKSLKPKKGGSL